VLPQLEGVYESLGPPTEALLRVAVGLALVPHGLRTTFGFFPTTGQPLRNIGMLADYLNKQGYRPEAAADAMQRSSGFFQKYLK